jgi:hypothetical protein
MKKNVASQITGAEMITISDGSYFTGSVTVYVKTDSGAQALGATASGVCTSEGHGLYTYVPSQAETNGEKLFVTFCGAGAVYVTKEYDLVTGVASNIKKNTALAGFQFQMTKWNGTQNVALTSDAANITLIRSIDGAATGAVPGSISEVSNGFYKVDLAASDLNGNSIRFTATSVTSGANQTDWTIITSP